MFSNINTTASSALRASEAIVEHSGRLLKAAGVIGARTIPALMVASIVTSGVGFAGELNQPKTPNQRDVTPDVQREGWRLFVQYQLANLVTFGGMGLVQAQDHLTQAFTNAGMSEMASMVRSIPFNESVSVIGVSDDIRRFERQYGDFRNLSTIYEDMAVLSDAGELLVSTAAQNLTPEQRAAAIATMREAYRASRQPEAEIQRIRAFVTNIETARGDRRTMNPDMRSILQSAAQLAELGPDGGALHSNGYWMGLRNVFQTLAPLEGVPATQNARRASIWETILNQIPNLDAAQSNFLNTFNGLINGLSSGNIGVVHKRFFSGFLQTKRLWMHQVSHRFHGHNPSKIGGMVHLQTR